MGRRWVKERKDEQFYRKAKKEGYRSRASFKLKQINKKFHLIRKGDAVVDLGCAPGGWLQVGREIVGDRGTVIGVDLARVRPVEGTVIVRGDMRDERVSEKVKGYLPSGRAHVIISDMSPDISGNYSVDHARSIELSETALAFAEEVLLDGGNFLVKVFQGDMFPDFLKKVKARFSFCKGHSPKASRSSSSEMYIVGKGYQGRTGTHGERSTSKG